jgi:O-antigen ligase
LNALIQMKRNRSMANRVVLTLVFTLSFLTYMAPDLSEFVQLAPLALFAGLVFFKVLWSESILNAVWSLFELDGLVYVLFIALLAIAPSLASASTKLIEMALIIIGCLILARLYMTVVPVREVFEAYFLSGMLSIALFIPLSLAGFLESLQTLQRFSAFSFHPNLLAFLLAGYFCAMVWKFLGGDWLMKILTGLIGLACLVIIFFASSRGSIVGILVGGLFASGIVMAGTARAVRKVLWSALLGAAALLGLFLTVRNHLWAQQTSTFVDQVLQLTQEDRGIDSGFSGRFYTWRAALRVFSDGTWLLGHGIRSSDSMSEGNWIDNSYLVVLYETGLVSLCLITWRLLQVLRRFSSGYLRSTNEVQRRLWLACAMLLTVFLVNNMVSRYLFSVGNPYSLVVLLFFATPTRVFASGLSAPQNADSRRIDMSEAHI